MHYYFYLSKVQIRKNVLKYSNEVKILRYIPPLTISHIPEAKRTDEATGYKTASFYIDLQLKC